MLTNRVCYFIVLLVNLFLIIYSILTDIFKCKLVELEYMRKSELRVIDCLRDHSYSVGDLADAINKSQSWTSEIVGDLENDQLVDRTDGVQLATTYEASLLAELLDRYALENVLTGMKENIIRL